MEVIDDFTNIGHYALFQTGYRDEQPSIWINHTYWFPDKHVVAGDLIILYSRSGMQTETKMKSGNTAHFFYWGKDESVWDDPDTCAVLLFGPDWEVFPSFS